MAAGARRWRSHLAVFGAVAVTTTLAASVSAPGSAAGAAGATTSPLAAGSRADGPFAVARTHATFVDTTRPTPANGTYPGSPDRTIRTVIFYPVPARRGGSGQKDAATAPVTRRFPLLVFAHGNSSNGPDNRPLLRRWASAGFVVAAPTFPLTSLGAPGGDDIGDYIHQPGDISFVITQLLAPNRSPDDPWRALIDPGRIGVVGHSLGAITVLGAAFNSCCRDPRITAAVSIDGIELPYPGGAYVTGLPEPLLVIHGTADQTIPFAAGQQVYAGASPPKYFLTLVGAPHTSFHQTDDPSSPRKPWQPVIVATVTNFFDFYLEGQASALRRLASDADVPGVSTLSFQRS